MEGQLEIITEVDDIEFKRWISKALLAAKDMKPPLKKCGIVMYKSFAKNFKEQGRPQKWAPLSPSTIERRRKHSTRILEDTGRLRMSVMSAKTSDSIYELTNFQLKMGTKLEYAEVQQFGENSHTITSPSGLLYIPFSTGSVAIKKVKHPGIKPRPFVMIQEEDISEMINIFQSLFSKE